MPKFLIEASLTSQGVKGVQNEGGTARREAVSKGRGECRRAPRKLPFWVR